ncbi:MAG TPA: Smr/MutS family protein [Geobacteraceae bacterium]|nr:Smr/MutS family protein [Geobacteraceae bacterium]
MKKRRKKDVSKKGFSNSPFKGLKGLAPEHEHTPAKIVEKVKPAPRHAKNDDEADLFHRYMEGVKRLDGSVREKGASPQPVAESKPPREEDLNLFLSSLEGMDLTFHDEIPDVEPLHPKATNRMRQVKNGTIRIDLELDLHGLTRDEALTSLFRFVTGAYNRGQKAVLVITGKGNHSAEEPVLQGAVTSWLRETGKKMVAEFAPAPRKLGGSGAYVVFLKEKKEEEDSERQAE